MRGEQHHISESNGKGTCLILHPITSYQETTAKTCFVRNTLGVNPHQQFSGLPFLSFPQKQSQSEPANPSDQQEPSPPFFKSIVLSSLARNMGKSGTMSHPMSLRFIRTSLLWGQIWSNSRAPVFGLPCVLCQQKGWDPKFPAYWESVSHCPSGLDPI